MSLWLDDESDHQGDLHNKDAPHWPDYVENGFAFIYGEYIPPYEVEAFRTRWGDLERETFIRVLSEGRGQDRLLAMCVLGESHLPQAPALLRPFLHSTDDEERWISALTLGKLKDEAALPVLIYMLTEALPTAEAPYSHSEDDARPGFTQWRLATAVTLHQWDDRKLVPVFRQALLANIRAEAYNPFRKDFWFSFQDVLISALGRWKAFGGLTGLVLSPTRLKSALMTLAAGACSSGYYYPDHVVAPWEKNWLEGNEPLRNAIKAILAEQFGLSEEEQEQHLEEYTRNLNLRYDE